ncbi:hypothetical protein AVEN_65705-1 [Araneus ventricosus]|uniref:Uncharacterized protein n=1 Tax=Araneus ventricosus TaxID=182803 RepID=A0A4Y2SZG2_ARAVE|nr:hypothetical protein AVEN_65705-1 [Araneus ventricosus]
MRMRKLSSAKTTQVEDVHSQIKGASTEENNLSVRGPPLREQLRIKRAPSSRRNARYQAEYCDTTPQNSREPGRDAAPQGIWMRRRVSTWAPVESEPVATDQVQVKGRASGSETSSPALKPLVFADPVQCDKYHECRNSGCGKSVP